MRRLLILSTLILVISLLLTSAVILNANRNTLSEYAAAMHFTDCELPCWIGIIPGKTTIKEAIELIAKTYGASGKFDVRIAFNEIKIINRSNQEGIHINLNFWDDEFGEKSVIDNIQLWLFAPDEALPMISEVYGLWNGPESVAINFEEHGGLELLYPANHLGVVVEDIFYETLGFNRRFYGVEIFTKMPEEGDWMYPPSKWYGFNRMYAPMGE